MICFKCSGLALGSLSPSSTSGALSVGAKVEAKFGGKGKFYPGTIEAANPDGTFAVLFDDGNKEPSAKPEHFKHIAGKKDDPTYDELLDENLELHGKIADLIAERESFDRFAKELESKLQRAAAASRGEHAASAPPPAEAPAPAAPSEAPAPAAARAPPPAQPTGAMGWVVGHEVEVERRDRPNAFARAEVVAVRDGGERYDVRSSLAWWSRSSRSSR